MRPLGASSFLNFPKLACPVAGKGAGDDREKLKWKNYEHNGEISNNRKPFRKADTWRENNLKQESERRLAFGDGRGGKHRRSTHEAAQQVSKH